MNMCPICSETGGHLVGCEWPYLVERNLHLTKGTVALCQKIASLEARLLKLERVKEAAQAIHQNILKSAWKDLPLDNLTKALGALEDATDA